MKTESTDAPAVERPSFWLQIWRATGRLAEVPDEKVRIPAAEGIRGFAALLVFFVHYQVMVTPYSVSGSIEEGIGRFLADVGHCGVDIFFILSGYLIYGGVLKADLSVIRFWGRRIRRIYPAFLPVFACYILLSYAFSSRSRIPARAEDAVTYLLECLLLLPGFFAIPPLFTVAWSLSFEALYYLTIPLIIKAGRMWMWTRRARIWFYLCCAAVYTTLFLTGVCFSAGYWSHARMLMFLSGILVYEATRSPSLVHISSSVGEWSAILLFVLSFPIVYLIQEYILRHQNAIDPVRFPVLLRSLVLGVASAVPLYYGICANGRMTRVLRFKPLRWVGNISYSFYLMHALTLEVIWGIVYLVFRPRPVAGVFWLGLAPSLAGALLASAALFTFFEKRYSLASPLNGSNRK